MKKIALVLLLAMAFLTILKLSFAQSAWVLWEGTIELSLPVEWKIVAAFSKYEQCIERQKKDFESIKKGFENLGFQTHLLGQETIVIEKVHSRTTSGDIIVTHKCLPDTIDPRK